MTDKNKSLAALNPGESYTILRLDCRGAKRRRLIDLGFAEGETVMCIGKSPLGDPVAYLVRGAVIALRQRDARDILVGEN
jgi:Fe2+ transport system protein FeoA